MGTPEFALPVLNSLVSEHDVAAVYTRPDAAAGRGRKAAASPVKQRSLELGLPVEQPANFKDPQVVSRFKEYRPEAAVVVAYGRILPPEVLEIPPYGCINVHYSLLPFHRGASPVAGSILAGDCFTGVSIMLMDEGMDTGPVITRAQVPVFYYDTSKSLAGRLSIIAAGILGDALNAWSKGSFRPKKQNNSEATYSGIISKEDGKIDWNESATTIWRKSKAYYPWPGIYTTWRGKTLKLHRVSPLQCEINEPPGTVIEIRENNNFQLGIATGEGVLQVITLQLEGKKTNNSTEFLRGQPGFIGSILPC